MSTRRAFLGVVRKDWRSWRQSPLGIIVTLLPVLLLLLITGIASGAVGRHPVAIVMLDSNGPLAERMAAVLRSSNAFMVVETDNATAHYLLGNLRVSAIITIPQDFDKNLSAGKPVTITYRVNNVNLDLASDLRRSLPQAITTFYASASTSGLTASPVKVHVAETDLRAVDVDLVQFMVVPALVLTMITSGLINGALAMVREWEDTTVKELILAPVGRSVIIAAKMTASWLTSVLIGSVIIIIAAAIGLLKPAGPTAWADLLSAVLLLTLFSSALGVTFGTILRTTSRIVPVSVNLSLYLFFLSGGFAVLAFLPAWVRSIATFIPNTYGVNALMLSAFYNTTEGIVQDLTVLGIAAAAAVALGVVAIKRGLA